MYGDNQICFCIKHNTLPFWYPLQYTPFLAIHKMKEQTFHDDIMTRERLPDYW